MIINDIIKELNLKTKTNTGNLDLEVTGGYVSDLLSDVIANCNEGYVWVTMQIHQNIVAVASMKDVSAIILVNNREPDENTCPLSFKDRPYAGGGECNGRRNPICRVRSGYHRRG